jgi:hypothetical protein
MKFAIGAKVVHVDTQIYTQWLCVSSIMFLGTRILTVEKNDVHWLKQFIFISPV